MSKIKNICVYCGSGPGTNPAFVASARAFGRILAENGIGLVYGGGQVGLMGEVSGAVSGHGGRVTGIIPGFLKAKERALDDSRQTLIVTEDMHERKKKMFEMADAFVALPGGIGTVEELVEQMTWAQLGRHKKPILIANIENFWAPFCTMLDHMRELAFIRAELNFELLVADRIEDVLPMLQQAAARTDESEKQMKVDVEQM